MPQAEIHQRPQNMTVILAAREMFGQEGLNAFLIKRLANKR